MTYLNPRNKLVNQIRDIAAEIASDANDDNFNVNSSYETKLLSICHELLKKKTKKGWSSEFRRWFDTGVETQKRRSFPVVNLDNPENNCSVCGYDHSHKNEDNELSYDIKHKPEEEEKEQVKDGECCVDNVGKLCPCDCHRTNPSEPKIEPLIEIPGRDVGMTPWDENVYDCLVNLVAEVNQIKRVNKLQSK